MSEAPRVRRRMHAMSGLMRRPARAAVLPLLGAALGLSVAGFNLLHPAPQSRAVPPGYVALVNQKGILRSDFMAQTAALAVKPFDETSAVERSQTLHAMIDEELLVQRGLALDLPETTTEVRDEMAAAVNAQVEAGTKAQPPSAAELKSFFDAHRADYSTIGSMSMRDLVLHVGGYQNADQSTAQAQTDAAEAAYQLRSGAALEQVMAHFGLADSGRAERGDMSDPAAKLHLGLQLFRVADGMMDGEISEPIADDDGVHLLVMERRNAPRAADFSSVQPKVYSDYMAVRAKLADEQNLAVLRKQAQILLAPDVVP